MINEEDIHTVIWPEKEQAGPRARGHHYLPVSFLKRFTDSNGFLHVLDFDKQTTFKTTPQKVGKIRDYYVAETIDRPDDLGAERILSSFEDKAGPVLEQITRQNRIPLDTDDWVCVCAFIAFLECRLPISRARYKHAVDWLVRVVAEAAAPMNESLEATRRLLDEGCISAHVPQNLYIRQMLEQAKVLAPLIGSMTPHLLVSQDAEFVTGDCPLPKRHRLQTGLFNGGWGLPAIEVAWPISSHHCIVLTWDPQPRVLSADRTAVANVNWHVVQFATRYVLGPRDTFVWIGRDKSVRHGAKSLFRELAEDKLNR
jgi:hypothetical protein